MRRCDRPRDTMAGGVNAIVAAGGGSHRSRHRLRVAPDRTALCGVVLVCCCRVMWVALHPAGGVPWSARTGRTRGGMVRSPPARCAPAAGSRRRRGFAGAVVAPASTAGPRPRPAWEATPYRLESAGIWPPDPVVGAPVRGRSAGARSRVGVSDERIRRSRTARPAPSRLVRAGTAARWSRHRPARRGRRHVRRGRRRSGRPNGRAGPAGRWPEVPAAPRPSIRRGCAGPPRTGSACVHRVRPAVSRFGRSSRSGAGGAPAKTGGARRTGPLDYDESCSLPPGRLVSCPA